MTMLKQPRAVKPGWATPAPQRTREPTHSAKEGKSDEERRADAAAIEAEHKRIFAEDCAAAVAADAAAFSALVAQAETDNEIFDMLAERRRPDGKS